MHGYLIRQLLEKYEQRRNTVDYNLWYTIDRNSLPLLVQKGFFQSTFDSSTRAYLEDSMQTSENVAKQVLHSIVLSLLGFFLSRTSINGLLHRGSMFVFSPDQISEFLALDGNIGHRTLLDLGAGDGSVTSNMAHLFSHITVTEMSPVMRWRLSQRGYSVVDIEEWKNGNYSVISALNLIDRCDKAAQLLSDVRNCLARTKGLFLLAVVLPFQPMVEKGSSIARPSEVLPIRGKHVLDQVASFVKDVLEPAGFELIRFTRLPYLSEGDLSEDFYVLDDYLFLLRVHQQSGHTPPT